MDIKEISKHLKAQLLDITPSRDWSMEYRPCQLRLKNGEIIDRVYVSEVDAYMKTWGVMPDQDEEKKYVLIEEVESINEYPNRMPVELADKLYEAGESGMGYCLYKIKFDNGQTIDVVTGNAVDFPPIPDGLTKENIKDVFPHQGSRKNPTESPDYTWCLFKGQMPKMKEKKQLTMAIPNKGFIAKLKNLFS